VFAKPDMAILIMSIRSSGAISEEAVAETNRKAKDVEVSWFSVKWRVAVFCKLLYSAAARREFLRHRGLSFDAVFA